MIKSNELRIGNYVMDAVSKEWMIVDEIGKNVGAVLIDRSKYPLPDGWEMAAIPLTTEILEKCGFVNVLYDGLVLDASRFKYMFDSCIVIDVNDGEYKYDIENCISLHQLQNLYFFNEGEELNIQL